MKILDLPVRRREKLGSAEARRHRRAGLIPCNLYGGGQDPVPLLTTRDEFGEILKGHTLLVTLYLGEEGQTAFIREVKWDTFGEFVAHVDFQRVDPSESVELSIPVLYVGTPVGTAEGGQFEKEMDALPLTGPLEKMPPQLRVDVAGMENGTDLRASEVELPEGLELACDAETMMAQVRTPKVVDLPEPGEEDEEAAVAAEGEEGAESGEDEGDESGGDDES